MSDELKDFRDALVTSIEADTTLTPELVAGSVVKARANASPQDITTQVATASAKSAGLALVLYNGPGRNLAADDDDGPIYLEAQQLMELYVHRTKWNEAYDSTKRRAESLLVGLIKLLHGATVGPGALPCYETLLFRDYAPVQDDEFEVWQIRFVRRMVL